jgi:ubiquinone/menaquinone biosynthesis C-methylase UbiE
MSEQTNSVTGACASNPKTVDFASVKARQQAMWASGDFAVIGTTLQITGEELCEAAELEAGSTVLDVACGNGNAALAAARRFCHVTGVDYVPALLTRAKERAAAERLAVEFVEGDAEAMPFADASFDTVLSTFGVMFAPDQVRAARELVRVTRPGGKIALANWTPEGFIGGLLLAVGKHVPPAPGLASPIYWGTEARLHELFPSVRKIHVQRRDFVFHYQSAEHFVAQFRRFYGPTHKAFNALASEQQSLLTRDILALIARFCRPQKTAAVAIPGEYLEVVIER